MENSKSLYSLMICIMLLAGCVDSRENSNYQISQGKEIRDKERLYVDSSMTAKFLFLDSLVKIIDLDANSQYEIWLKSTEEIMFMEMITGLESSYPGGRLGREFIYQKDLDNWYAWYERNKLNLNRSRIDTISKKVRSQF